tara:strand:+ start:719 stop:1093 length:375 start_codon:yes stop_codon:yes gene_type:complete
MVNSFFDFVNNIAFERKEIDINISDSQLYSAYITNRYITFINKECALLINNTVNKFGLVFNNELHYKLLFNLIPKTKRKFIRYIKKEKKDKKTFERTAKLYELSQREIQLYSENFGVNIKKYEQ